MAVPRVRIWIADEGSPNVGASRAASDDRLNVRFTPSRQMRFGEHSAGWVAKHRQTLHIPDIFNDARVSHCQPVIGIRSTA